MKAQVFAFLMEMWTKQAQVKLVTSCLRELWAKVHKDCVILQWIPEELQQKYLLSEQKEVLPSTAERQGIAFFILLEQISSYAPVFEAKSPPN